MKRLILGTLLAVTFMFIFAPVIDQPKQVAFAQDCVKIKDGTLKAITGETLKLGYDEFGYNYQARIFNGTYDSVDREYDGTYFGSTGDYLNDSLVMKWSEDWLSNQDCNGDGKLDRGDAGISKGWTTNLVEGDYMEGEDSYHYTYFAKIVWVGPAPAGADPWGGDVSTGGSRIWGQYAIIEEIYNDPHGGFHGVDKSKLANPAGLGFYTN